jgi:hypothetical protein
MGDGNRLSPDSDAAVDRTKPSRASGRKESGRLERILKFFGAATAVLSLGGAIYGLGNFLHGVMQDRSAVADLIVIARNQQHREQYREAWATLAQASGIEQTSRLVIDRRALQQAKEDLAMAWLRNVRIGEAESFTAIAAMVEPVLDRGQGSAGPHRKADLLAHLGWAAFLRFREQGVGPDVPERMYRNAIAVDPANPYANAMLGHWLMWQDHDVETARAYFATALDSGRAPEFVRGLQLAALQNANSAEAGLEQIRVANEMRKADRSSLSVDRSDLWDVYHSFFRADAGEYALQRILSVVPPEEHLRTFHWLFDQAGFDEAKEAMRICYVGLLLEAAGHRQQALETFRDLWQKVEGWQGAIHDRVQSGIRRLSIEPQ